MGQVIMGGGNKIWCTGGLQQSHSYNMCTDGRRKANPIISTIYDHK